MPKVNIDNKFIVDTEGKRTLLEELEQQNLDVNYSCRSGFCGACKATVVNGSVVQTENNICKLAEDEILTCCTRAEEDVELTFKNKVNIFQSTYALNI